MDNEAQEYNNFIGPGWYMFVIIAGLDFIYHLSKNTQPVWLAVALAITWGFVAWGAVSFLVWSISEYFPGNDEDTSTPVPVSAPENLSKKNSELLSHMNTVLFEDNIKIGGSIVMLDKDQRKQVRSYFFHRWEQPTVNHYFGSGDLPSRVINKLVEKGYTGREGDDLFRLTMTGEELFPSGVVS
ncbi:MAG: hypothetical protein DRI46_07790 [Chloroflexi bacterium]|nr:MAG: hypothetical protein DRI46_07790 [Chloroflexota bacterium]